MDAIDRKAIEAILFLDKYCRSHVGDCEKCVACHCSGGACIDISLEQRAMLTNDLQHCGPGRRKEGRKHNEDEETCYLCDTE